MRDAKTRLQIEREKNGWTLSDLSERTGFHRQVIWHWENSRSRPDGDQLRALADVLGVENPKSLLDIFELRWVETGHSIEARPTAREKAERKLNKLLGEIASIG